jgi:hypothetical protein
MSTSLHIEGLPFIDDTPCEQNAVSLFRHWASRFPEGKGLATDGQAGLFEDERILWLDEQLRHHTGRGIRGRSILELGPLEAGHTYMLDRLGASSVVSVEANSIAYLKCLIAKETLGISSAHFILGNALRYLEQCTRRFDLCVCSGFLYHQRDPLRVLQLLSGTCDHLYLWTQTYHESLFEKQPAMRQCFGPPREVSDGDLHFTLHPHHYGEIKDYEAFWGGTEPSSCWMRSEDIQATLEHFGLNALASREESNLFGIALNILSQKAN